MSGKPNQKFELNFQNNISDELAIMTKHQLILLLFTILNILPISMELMCEFKNEFVNLFTVIGSLFSQDIKSKYSQTKEPDMEKMAQSNSRTGFEQLNPFLSALISGLGGPNLNKNICGNIIEGIIKIACPDYNSCVGWRDSLVIYVRTYSKSTISTLTQIGAYPTYRQIYHFINKLKPSFNIIRENEDLITSFDNEQKLKKAYRLGGVEGSNKMTVSLCTMVLHFYPFMKTKLQYMQSLSPAKWLWNKIPDNFRKIKKNSNTLFNDKQ